MFLFHKEPQRQHAACDGAALLCDVGLMPGLLAKVRAEKEIQMDVAAVSNYA